MPIPYRLWVGSKKRTDPKTCSSCHPSAVGLQILVALCPNGARQPQWFASQQQKDNRWIACGWREARSPGEVASMRRCPSLHDRFWLGCLGPRRLLEEDSPNQAKHGCSTCLRGSDYQSHSLPCPALCRTVPACQDCLQTVEPHHPLF